MKKYGLISDIHNNPTALKIMLEYFEDRGIENIICTGDFLSIGPFPRETVALAMGIKNLIAVSGNHDRYLSEGVPDYVNMREDGRAHHAWEQALLSEEQKAFICSLPIRVFFEAEGVRVAVLHYAMNEKDEYIRDKYYLEDEDYERLFGDIDCDIVLFGHDHKRSFFEKNGKKYINAGSLGCPYTFGSDIAETNARGAVLTLVNGKSEIEFIDIPYDTRVVAEKITEINYPCADYMRRCFYGV